MMSSMESTIKTTKDIGRTNYLVEVEANLNFGIEASDTLEFWASVAAITLLLSFTLQFIVRSRSNNMIDPIQRRSSTK